MNIQKAAGMLISVLIMIVVLGSCATFGSPATEAEKRKQQVFDFPGSTIEQLYDYSNRWFVESFGDATAVIEYSNEEAGTIMGKYTYRIMILGPLALSVFDRMEVTIQLEMRDEGARMTILNPRIRSNPSSSSAGPSWSTPTSALLKKADYEQHTNRMFRNYKQYINQDQGEW